MTSVNGLRAAVFAGVFLAASSASAAVISFDFTAEGIAGLPNAGGIVEGTFGWDTSSPDQSPSPNQGVYAAFMSGTISGGSQDGGVFSRDDLRVFVQVGPQVAPGAPLASGNIAILEPGGTPPSRLQLFNGEVVSDALPTELDLADFIGLPTGSFGIFNGFAVGSTVAGLSSSIGATTYEVTNISRIELTPVPIPASMPILLTAIFGLFALRRKARH